VGAALQVDVFAVYSITLVGGRHVILPTFTAAEVLATIGESAARGLPATSRGRARQPPAAVPVASSQCSAAS
jgi:hypothetical protein